jgi:PPM family protein phosphatase
MRIRIAAVTHRGLVRDHNEDCIGWTGWALNGETPQPLSIEFELVEPVAVVVCDGMGGHAAGETASRLATARLTAPGIYATSDMESVTHQIQLTSDVINDAAQNNPTYAGMGCTVVGLVLRPDGTALVFNIGDSRCYRVEGQYLAQLSVDHRKPGTSTLTQALGGGLRVVVEPDFYECEIPSAQGLILCSDGLDDYAEFSEIEQSVLRGGPELVAELRDLALAGGGGDNVTIVQVTKVEQGEVRG